MVWRPVPSPVVVHFAPWPRGGQVVPLGLSWCYTALLLALVSVPFRLCPCSPRGPDGLASCLVLLVLFLVEEARGQWHLGLGRVRHEETLCRMGNGRREPPFPLVYPFWARGFRVRI